MAEPPRATRWLCRRRPPVAKRCHAVARTAKPTVSYRSKAADSYEHQ